MTRSAWSLMAIVGWSFVAPAAALAAPTPPASTNPDVACHGVRDADSQIGLFTDARNIVRYQRLTPRQPASETETAESRGGVRIFLTARPGMTPEWLQRIAECHIAREIAKRYQDATQSPLDVPGITVSVTSTGDGFAVDLLADTAKAADELVRRTTRVAKPAGS
ncbi:MAG TPA: hypothetical protein VHJ20_15610 [Polyangia bacterium]|nr:hypothetical protein [Polyangia bacterium]